LAASKPSKPVKKLLTPLMLLSAERNYYLPAGNKPVSGFLCATASKRRMFPNILAKPLRKPLSSPQQTG
jgi:hypothetical protein